MSVRGSDEPDVGTAVAPVRRARRAAVSLRDQRDDRESRGRFRRCALVRPAEAVECALEEAAGKPGPSSVDVQLDDVVARDCKEVDRALLRERARSPRDSPAPAQRVPVDVHGGLGRVAHSTPGPRPPHAARNAPRPTRGPRRPPTRSGRSGSPPWSARAMSSRSSASSGETLGLLCSRAQRVLELVVVARPPQASSSSVRSMASGVRSSWLASATKRRSCSKAASSRSSISFSVVASREISSRAGRHRAAARRRRGDRGRRRRIASTGRRAAAARP